MATDIVNLVDKYISMDSSPQKWTKLSSTVTSRGLELLLLKEILIELRKLNKTGQV